MDIAASSIENSALDSSVQYEPTDRLEDISKLTEYDKLLLCAERMDIETFTKIKIENQKD